MKAHSYVPRWRILLAAALVSVATPAPASTQEPVDSLRAEVERLSALLDSLRVELERLRASGEEAEAARTLEQLRAAAQEAAAAAAATREPTSAPQQFVGRQRSLQSLNPEISLNADVMAHLDPDDRDADNFFWREFEISIQSALDPFSRAVLFLSRHGSGPEVEAFGDHHGDELGEEAGHDEHGGEGFDIEEGYVEWVGLPGGVGLKFGKFFQRFGTLNRWHAHALPFQSRSLPHLAFLGEEALAQSGVSATWLTPFGGGAAGTYEVTLELTRAENESLFAESHKPTVLTHVNGFWQLGSAVDLELGGSWLRGHYEDDVESFARHAYNVEMALNWLPPARSRRTGLLLRGGYMRLEGLPTPETVTAEPLPASVDGFWSLAELRLSRAWLIGARFDRAYNPAEPDESRWLVSPTLTWWQSEFVRLRAELDVLNGLEGGDGSRMFTIAATFAMGPHKHATY